MSASREKKKRFEERSNGTDKRQERAKVDLKANKRKKLITTIVAVVLVVLVVVGVVFNSNLFYTGVPAVHIGGEKYTASDFNYEYFNTYYNTYSNIAATYGSYASILLDTKTPLDKQNYSEDMTWADYFETQAFEQLQQMTILNDMAKAEGWKLTDEQYAEIEASIDSLKTSAANQNYTDYRAYIRALYGKGITENRLRSLLEKSYNATYYSEYLGNKWMDAYTEDELADYYAGIHKDYDLYTYMSYFVSGSADEETGVDAETAMNEARRITEEVAAAHDRESFMEAIYRTAPEGSEEDFADESAFLNRLVSASSISNPEWKDWLTDDARTGGDTQVFTVEGSGCYVFLFLERSENDYAMANFRGITVDAALDETTGAVSEATRAEAQKTVDAILAAFEEEPTEEKFAELADQYDVSGLMNGGLYENTVLGQLACEEAEAYVFGEEAKPGQVRTFYDNGRYYIVYPMERGERYDLFIAKNLKVGEQYTAALEAAKEDYPIKTGFAFRFTK